MSRNNIILMIDELSKQSIKERREITIDIGNNITLTSIPWRGKSFFTDRMQYVVKKYGIEFLFDNSREVFKFIESDDLCKRLHDVKNFSTFIAIIRKV